MSPRDSAERGLRFAVTLLPKRRRGWGEAMLAELAAIDGGMQRRRFAVSCARGVLGDTATLASLAGRLAVAGTAVGVAVLAGSAPLVTMEAGAALIGAVLLGAAGRQAPPLGAGIRDRAGRPPAGCCAPWVWVSIGTTALWWVSVLLLDGLRQAGWWSLLLAVGAGAAAAVVAGTGRHRAVTGTGSAAVTALLVFISAVAPNTVGSAGADQVYRGGPPPPPVGLIPTVDPYVAVLLAGALPALAAALLAADRASRSRRRTGEGDRTAVVASTPS